jgi:ribosomal protein S18 acetylase RimI-like enzyme
VHIDRLGPGDGGRVIAATHLFDAEPKPDATERFLAEPGHHLLLAVDEGTPAGFITGVEVTHPDKGTEMFLYELGVDAQHQRRGIGVALVGALEALARKRGCYGMWVLTDDDNTAALATYERAGAKRDGPQAMLSWDFPTDVAHPADGP